MEKDKYVCKLCNKQYKNDEMSEEHYPAKSVGNDDIGKFDLTKFIDIFDSKSIKEDIYQKLKKAKILKIFVKIFLIMNYLNQHINMDELQELYVKTAIIFLVNMMKHI